MRGDDVMKSILENTNVIKDYQDGLSLRKIGDKYGVSPQSVKYFLNKKGINTYRENRDYSMSPYSFDIHWLDKIDTQEKAYFLGFVYADGSLSGEFGYYDLMISLNVIDRYLLEKFNELLNSDRPVKDYTRENSYNKKGVQNYCVVHYANKYFWKHMQELGVIPNKTTTVKLPNFISKELMPHFIRGYFDGDGSISLSHSLSGSRPAISITSSTIFCSGLKEYLENELGINSNITLEENYGIISINRIHEAKKFLDWIYKDSKIHLIRKYDKYIEFINSRDFNVETIKEKNRRLINNIEEIIKDRESGMLYKDIAQKYACTPLTIYRLLKKYK